MDDGTSRAICNGEKLLCKELQRIHWKNKLHFRQYIYIIVSREGIVCKQITSHDIDNGIITCHSWNPVFEDYTINLEDVIQIFYVKKVVERRIRFYIIMYYLCKKNIYMKNLITLLLLISNFCYSQDHTAPLKLNDKGKLYYQKIFTDSTLRKSELYNSSLRWFIKTSKDSKETLKFSDENSGQILGEITTRCIPGFAVSEYISCDLTIIVKEGKAKILFDQIRATDPKYGDHDIENYYYINGNTQTGKIRTGWKGTKEKMTKPLENLADDWINFIKSNDLQQF